MKSPEIHLFSDASEGQAPLRTIEFKRDILGRLIRPIYKMWIDPLGLANCKTFNLEKELGKYASD